MDSDKKQKTETKETKLVLSDKDRELLNQFLDIVITLIMQKIEQDYVISRKNDGEHPFRYRV